jgi:hypothetical protein
MNPSQRKLIENCKLMQRNLKNVKCSFNYTNVFLVQKSSEYIKAMYMYKASLSLHLITIYYTLSYCRNFKHSTRHQEATTLYANINIYNCLHYLLNSH